MLPAKILIIDDNETFREQLKIYLENYFFKVEIADDGLGALSIIDQFVPDILVLDVHMPGKDGLDICRSIRARPQYREGQLGIIMVSGERQEMLDRVAGLEMGADKYLTKPVTPRHLVAEIKSLLRVLQAPLPTTSWLVVDERFRLNLEERIVEIEAKEVHFTKLEFDVLAYLADPPNIPRSRSELAEQVWQEPIDDGPINRVVAVLRQKIERDPASPEYLKTVYGIGYKLVVTKVGES